jgi:Phage integrase family
VPLVRRTWADSGAAEKYPKWVAVVGTFHMLRHSYATALIQSGESAKTVATLVGHHSVAFTMDQYAVAWPEAISGTAEKVAGVLFGTSGSISVAVSGTEKQEPAQVVDLDGGPCADRTRDQLVKSQLLYR